MFDTLPIKIGPKQGAALSSLLFSFALEYAIWNRGIEIEGDTSASGLH